MDIGSKVKTDDNLSGVIVRHAKNRRYGTWVVRCEADNKERVYRGCQLTEETPTDAVTRYAPMHRYGKRREPDGPSDNRLGEPGADERIRR